MIELKNKKMQKKQNAFLKKLSGYLAFSYFHKYCYTLTKNADEITQSNLQRLSLQLLLQLAGFSQYCILLHVKHANLTVNFYPFSCNDCALLSYLINLHFSYHCFFFLRNLNNYFYLFIYLLFTQPATNSLCYLRVVF